MVDYFVIQSTPDNYEASTVEYVYIPYLDIASLMYVRQYSDRDPQTQKELVNFGGRYNSGGTQVQYNCPAVPVQPIRYQQIDIQVQNKSRSENSQYMYLFKLRSVPYNKYVWEHESILKYIFSRMIVRDIVWFCRLQFTCQTNKMFLDVDCSICYHCALLVPFTMINHVLYTIIAL